MAGKQIIDTLLTLKKRCRFEEEIGRELGLSPGELGSIWALPPPEELSCQALSERLDLSPSRCSRIIQALFIRGYVNRDEKSGDRRSFMLSLTPEGESCRRQITRARKRCEQRLLTLLDPEQQARIREGLETLIQAL